jgi:hypothetical protein
MVYSDKEWIRERRGFHSPVVQTYGRESLDLYGRNQSVHFHRVFGLVLLEKLSCVTRRLTELLVAPRELAFRESLPFAKCASICDDNSIS